MKYLITFIYVLKTQKSHCEKVALQGLQNLNLQQE